MAFTHATVKTARMLTPTVLELVVQPSLGKEFAKFKAGQYATISFPNIPELRGQRSFSIASPATKRNELRFGIRVGGTYTSRLLNLRPGEAVSVNGPFGHFTFDHARDRSVVLIAGGIGITPFLSMIQTAAAKQLANEITLFYSVRSVLDAPYLAQLEKLSTMLPTLRRVTCVSDDVELPKQRDMVQGRITRDMLWAGLQGRVEGRTYFVCGPPAFMHAVTSALVSLGVPEKAIHTERFSVGSSALLERHTPVPKLLFAGWATAAMLVLGTLVKVEQAKRAAAATTITVPQDAANTSPSTSTTVVDTTPTSVNTNTSAQGGSASGGNTSTKTVTTTPKTVTPKKTVAQPVQQPTYVPVQMPRTRMS